MPRKNTSPAVALRRRRDISRALDAAIGPMHGITLTELYEIKAALALAEANIDATLAAVQDAERKRGTR